MRNKLTEDEYADLLIYLEDKTDADLNLEPHVERAIRLEAKAARAVFLAIRNGPSAVRLYEDWKR